MSANPGPDAVDAAGSLESALLLAARLQGRALDRLQLRAALDRHDADVAAAAAGTRDPYAVLGAVALAAGVEDVDTLEEPDVARLPCLAWLAGAGWGVVRHRTPQGLWRVEVRGRVHAVAADARLRCVRLVFLPREGASERPARALLRGEFHRQRGTLTEAAAAGIVINLLALVVSFYSMLVYDRVIPTQGYATLIVLTAGVAIALVFDVIMKVARAHLMEHAIVQFDSALARQIFARLLRVRLDQLPATVGSLSAQLRGYETIRAFLSASTLYLLVDTPFTLLFIVLIAIIGTPQLALVPLGFLAAALLIGLLVHRRVRRHAEGSTAAGNRKTGLLVEAIEGAETVKAGAGGWSFLARWIETHDEALGHDIALRTMSEKGTYLTGFMQQASYVALVAAGAYFAGQGDMTMGALIACSILSGRALAPVAQLTQLMVQGAHARAALEGLEAVFRLETDNHGLEQPLAPETVRGEYRLERVRFAYGGGPDALIVPQLGLRAGEKVGIIGPVGAGKSTLLRLLTGMYQPVEGRVLLDGLDIDQIARQTLAEAVGYLQQDHRLFSGTLRQNLLVGTPDPGDEALRDAAARTGLLATIATHPRGLEMPIAEGGRGLSGGQRQLVALTRLFIARPVVWLLDEPTATMDTATEQRCLAALKDAIRPDHTLVLVTHKPQLLGFVDRLLYVADQRVVLDSPRDDVLKRLAAVMQSGRPTANPT